MLVNVPIESGLSSIFSRDSIKLSLDGGIDRSVLSISPIFKSIFGLRDVQSDTLLIVALMALLSKGNVICF